MAHRAIFDLRRFKSRVSLPLFLHPRREVMPSHRHTVGSYVDERMHELRIDG